MASFRGRASTAAVLLCSWLAASTAAAASKNKRAQLLAETAASSSRVVKLLPSNYTNFVIDSPRDYDIIVLYTASEAKYGCTTCASLARELKIAATSYEAAYPSGNRSAEAGDSDGASSLPARDVFFGVVDFKNNQDAFAMHGFRSVPHVALHPRTHERGATPAPLQRAEKLQNKPIAAEFLQSPTDGNLPASAIMAMLPAAVRVSVQRPAEERLGIAFVVVAVVAFLGALSAADASNALFFMKTWFWRAVSFAFFAVSVSGAISCVIKGSPWYGSRPNGGVTLFSGGHGHHDQYYAEGAVIGALNVAAALGVIALVSVSKSRHVSAFGKALLGCAAAAVFLVAYARIFGYYQEKTSWYKLDALVPAHMRKTLWDAYATWLRGPALRAYAMHLQPHVAALQQHELVVSATSALGSLLR